MEYFIIWMCFGVFVVSIIMPCIYKYSNKKKQSKIDSENDTPKETKIQYIAVIINGDNNSINLKWNPNALKINDMIEIRGDFNIDTYELSQDVLLYVRGDNNSINLKWNPNALKINDMIEIRGDFNIDTYELSQDVLLYVRGDNNTVNLNSIEIGKKTTNGDGNSVNTKNTIYRAPRKQIETKTKDKDDVENMSNEELDTYIKDKRVPDEIVDEAFNRLEKEKND